MDFNCLLAASEDPPTPRAGVSHDSSTGELQPMPTSPATDMQSPVPYDNSLFSSPMLRPSGTALFLHIVKQK